MFTRLQIAKACNSKSILSTCRKTKVAFKVVLAYIIIGIAFIKQTTLPGYFSKLRRVKFAVLFLTALISSAATLLPLNQAFAETQNVKRTLFLGDRNYPPYEFLENGKPKGLAVDILYAVMREAGVEVELRLMQWSKAQELVLARHADGHAIMTPTPSREKNYDFSRPVVNIAYVLFVNEPHKNTVNVDSLAGLKIGVTKGGLPFQYLSEFHPEADLIIVKNDIDGFGKLLTGELDATSTNRLTGLYQIRKHGATGIVPVPWSLVEKEMKTAIRKGDPALLVKINVAIESLQKRGELKRIKDQWLSNYSPGCDWTDARCYLVPGAGVATLFGLLYFLVARLRSRRRGRG